MPLKYQAARALRQRATDVEQKLWYQLRNRNLAGCKFRRQQPIGSYVVDFACMERKLGIELDGGQHLEQEAADRYRTAFLQAEGYRILRFWNSQILEELDGVLAKILRALADPTYPSPNPLPQGERA